ncbi:490_t:CDS:2 [Entrophospora sp. SA101]|nr:490_t:CDS:2 [Entrophospora sp. SA101]
MNDNDFMVENDASSTSSISSISTAQSIQRRTRSIAWNHFTTIDGKARCNYCSSDLI